VFYAYSPVYELDFTPGDRNRELFADPHETALDWTREPVDPHEYNGIAWYGNTVWTAYAGTLQADPFNEAVISFNRVIWIWP
jgi:hypothetical protein